MIDFQEVNKAKYFAIGAHGTQKRKYTHEPYWFHLRNVVEILLTHCKKVNTVMLQSAWLHDVVEDTQFSIYDIKDHFGLDVFYCVHKLTDSSLFMGNRATRKAIDRERLSKSDPMIQTIKYADIIDNTSSIVYYDIKFSKVYLEEKRQLLEVMNKGDEVLYKMACEQC